MTDTFENESVATQIFSARFMLFYPIDVSVDRYKVIAINGSKKNYKKEIKTFLQIQ